MVTFLSQLPGDSCDTQPSGRADRRGGNHRLRPPPRGGNVLVDNSPRSPNARAALLPLMKRFSVCLPRATAGFALWYLPRHETTVAGIDSGLSGPAGSALTGRHDAAPPQPGADSVIPSPRAAPLRTLRQDIRWQQPVAEPEFADFKTWTQDHAAAKTGIEEGVKLARSRRSVLLDMIEKDLRPGLELAVPESVRRTLPAAVLAELDERVRGRGDLLVAAATPVPPGTVNRAPGSILFPQ